jgi:hypothetical protein
MHLISWKHTRGSKTDTISQKHKIFNQWIESTQIKSNIYFSSRQAVYNGYYCKAAHYMMAQTIIWYVLYKV